MATAQVLEHLAVPEQCPQRFGINAVHADES
jgi:hypothetical protein